MSRRAERREPGAGVPAPDVLRARAELLAHTRTFFAARGVLEVETPVLGRGIVVDAHIDPITCAVGPPGREERRHLLPSPEAPMKRLLAAGSGPIYEIGRAFRQGEAGRLHRPEFTMLEWYRPGVPYTALMDEVADLLHALTGCPPAARRTVREAFRDALGIDPHVVSTEGLAALARAEGVAFADPGPETTRADWLDLLFATRVEPALDPDVPTFVVDFPACQCALAELRPGDPPVAQRFELLYRGMELANGYEELRDAAEHRRRFAAENARRTARGKDTLPPDEALLAAVEGGLPQCSGVALGFDRIVMIACGAASIDDVVVVG